MVLMLFACIPHLLPQQAEVQLPVDVAVVTDQLDQRAVLGAPAAVQTVLTDALERRNLKPQFLAPEVWLQPFTAARSSGQRLRWMFGRAEGSDMQLLVETSASFYSFIGGRYRWTVTVILTLSSKESPGDEQQERFEVPIFLDHDHEREAEAIAEAAPFIGQRAGGMLDVWLGGR